MKIHSEFFALTPEGKWIARELNNTEVCDGAYARVRPLSNSRVLKATCCPATNLLFEELLQLGIKKKSLPDSLPVVFKKFGITVRDSENFKYTAWEVERLFEPGQLAELRRARLAGDEQYRRLKPSVQHTVYLSNKGESPVEYLQGVLEQVQDLCSSPNTWQGCAEIALNMSIRTKGDLKKTFLFLYDFLERHQVVLDLLTQGNILLDRTGRACLSDPVSEAQEAEPELVKVTGMCVGAYIPSAMRGWDIQMEPQSSFPLNESEISSIEVRLSDLGLTSTRLQWGSAEHRNFLAQPGPSTKLWQVQKAAQNMRENVYEEIFALQ